MPREPAHASRPPRPRLHRRLPLGPCASLVNLNSLSGRADRQCHTLADTSGRLWEPRAQKITGPNVREGTQGAEE